MKLIYIYLAIFLMFISCNDDKGNYDYTLLNRVTIGEFGFYGMNTSLGDTITYSPELTFSGDTTSDNFDFEWVLFDTKKIKSRDLFYIVDTIASGIILLRVTDKKTGAAYTQHTTLTTKSPYETNGFVILSRGAGNESILSYFRESYNSNYNKTETNYNTYKEYFNVYEDINKEALGKDPIRVMQHFHEDDYNHDSETGNFWILQGNNNSVDVSGVSFEKDVLLKDQFLDGVPAGFEPYDIVDMRWGTFVIGKDGKMYSRKKSSQFLFNSGYFLSEPVTFEENGHTYEVNGLGVVHHRYAGLGYTLLYEKNLNRFLLIMDSDQQSAGKIATPFVPNDAYESEDVARINNLGNMKMIHCGAYKSNTANIGFYAILQDPDGIFYSYDFGMNTTIYGGEAAISTVKQKVLPDATQQTLSSIIGNGKNIFNTGYTDASAYGVKQLIGYVLITRNNELWLLNRATGTITLYDTFEADITAIDSEIYNAWFAGIGLANGKFYVEEISAPAFTNEIPRRMFSFKESFGEEIISVKYKNGKDWM